MTEPRRAEAAAGRRVLSIGGLAKTTRDEQLNALFSTHGLVAWARIVRRTPGGEAGRLRLRGMTSSEQALRAS